MSQPQTQSNSTFFDLVEQLVDLAPRADSQVIEAFLVSHPEHAERLKELLPALEALADFSESGAAVPPNPDDTEAARLGQLGDFRILRELGRGGMGVVYEAWQITLGRRVALKILPFAGALDPRQRQRFQNEAMAAAQLRHPNIVGVHFVGSERGVHFYAMELIEGRTLADYLAELRGERRKPAPQSPLQPTNEYQPNETKTRETEPIAELSTEEPKSKTDYYRQVAKWGRQIAEALEYAHSVGVVHRDIKPSNILLDEAGEVWITDFGLAQFGTGEAALTMTGDILGTLRYMSPEQAQGDHRLVDHRTDLYSLGITLYELLAKRPAFPGNDRAKLLSDVIHTEPRPPRQLDQSLPKDLETIVLKAIAKEPGERYHTLKDLADDLGRFLGHETIKARRPNLKDRVVKWSRRHRGLVLTSSLLSTLLTIVIAVSAVLVIQEQQARENDKLLAKIALSEERGKRLEEEQERRIQAELAKQGAEAERHQRYVSDIQSAWQAWNRSQVLQMREHLDRCLPQNGETDIRSWEWWYLLRLSQEIPKEFGRHRGDAYYLALSPDESVLASCGPDGVRFWDTKTLKQVRHLDKHRADVNWASFSPDGKLFATASDDQTAKIWDAKNGSLVTSFRFKNLVLGAEFSPDGKRLAVVERGWESANNRVNIYSVENWRLEKTWHAHDGTIHDLVFSPDSTQLATCSDDNFCKIWDLNSSSEIPEMARVGHPSKIFGVCYLPGGSQLALSAGNEEIFIWDWRTDQVTSTIVADRDGIESLTLSPRTPSRYHAQWVISSSRSGGAKLWRVNPLGIISQRPYARFLCPSGVRAAVLNSNHEIFTADRDGVVRRSTIAESSGRAVQVGLRKNCPDGMFVFLGDGDRVVQGKCGVYVYDALEEKDWIKGLLSAETFPEGGEAIAVSLDGKRLASATPAGEVFVWDTQTWETVRKWSADETWHDHERYIDIGISPNGGEVFLFDKERDTLQLDVASGKVSTLGKQVTYYGWSPDGKYRVEKDELTVHSELREVATGEPAPITIPGDSADLEWSPDGSLVAAVTWSGWLQIWETNSWRELAQFQAVPNGTSGLAISADGRTIAVSDERGDTHLWNVATKRELIQLHFPLAEAKAYAAPAFSRNARSLGVQSYRAVQGGPSSDFFIWNTAPRGEEALE